MLGLEYEAADRLRDAENAYARVLADGSPSIRVFARARIARVLDREEREWPTWAHRWIQSPLYWVRHSTRNQVGLLIFVLASFGSWLVSTRREVRSQVQLTTFSRQISPSTGSAIEATITDTHRRLEQLLKPIVLQPTSARVPVLMTAPGETLIELVDAATKQPVIRAVLTRLVRAIAQPRFRISGHVEGGPFEVRLVGQLFDGPHLVREVTKLVPTRRAREAENELAYDLLLALMERVK